MAKLKPALVLPLALLTAVGCSSSDNRYEPMDEPEITNLFSLDEIWSSSTGGVSDYFSELTMALDDHYVYTAARNGEVLALSQANGDEIWSRDLSDEAENNDRRSVRLSGGVAYHAGKLAVGSENGYIYLLSSADGSLLWKSKLQAEIVASPAFNESGDRLFVLDSRGNFTALDSATGETVWVTGDSPQPLRLRAQAAPLTVGDNYVLVGTSTGRVNVILQSTGATVNQITVGSAVGANALERLADVSGTPLLLGNTMYASSFAGTTVEYDFGTFSTVARLGYQSSRNFGFDESALLITSDDGTVYCINRADNSQRWANTQLGWRNVTAPAVYGNYAVVGDYEGYLYLIDMADGSIDFMDEIDSSGLYSQPQVKNGRLFVQARDGSVVSLALPDTSVAVAKEQSNASELAHAGQGLVLNHPGVYDSGIYMPTSMTQEQLEARRQAIRRAVAQQDAQIAAQKRAAAEAARARAEYEAKRAAYEQERREQLSGFGIAAGIRSEMEDEALPQQAEPETEDVKTEEEENTPRRKSSNFGI